MTADLDVIELAEVAHVIDLRFKVDGSPGASSLLELHRAGYFFFVSKNGEQALLEATATGSWPADTRSRSFKLLIWKTLEENRDHVMTTFRKIAPHLELLCQHHC